MYLFVVLNCTCIHLFPYLSITFVHLCVGSDSGPP